MASSGYVRAYRPGEAVQLSDKTAISVELENLAWKVILPWTVNAGNCQKRKEEKTMLEEQRDKQSYLSIGLSILLTRLPGLSSRCKV